MSNNMLGLLVSLNQKMSEVELQKISIDQLTPGMYVQSIVEQRGKLKIKSQGKVKSDGVVNHLKKQGILALLIDPSKAFNPETGELVSTPTPEAPLVEDISPVEKDTPHVAFEQELARANKLHNQGKGIQKRMLNSIARGLPVDIKVPQEFTENLVGSIDRNPNALMCLTKIREKDSYLMEHSLNVAILLANFARSLGLSNEDVEELALTGFIHDIGKIKVPDEILHKPGRLTDPEMSVMKEHVAWGIQTLQQMDMPPRIIRTMGEHHERLDGNGYPKGAKGDNVSHFGRMIAIVDTYDAITADRCYKAGMSSQKALKILLQDSPDKYDRGLVQQFIKCVGIHPVGSLVKLDNDQVGMVVSQNDKDPLKPEVKVFYSLKGKHYLSPKNIDLHAPGNKLKIEKAMIASELGIDFNRFFEEKIAL